MSNCEYVIQTYRVPACIGRIISFKGQLGTIIKDRGNYIGVNFDNDKPGVVTNLHPTWKVEYLGMGKVRKLTRSQQKYRDFIDADYGCTFAEYLGIERKRVAS